SENSTRSALPHPARDAPRRFRFVLWSDRDQADPRGERPTQVTESASQFSPSLHIAGCQPGKIFGESRGTGFFNPPWHRLLRRRRGELKTGFQTIAGSDTTSSQFDRLERARSI